MQSAPTPNCPAPRPPAGRQVGCGVFGTDKSVPRNLYLCTPDWTRTSNLFLRREAFCPIELRALIFIIPGSTTLNKSKYYNRNPKLYYRVYPAIMPKTSQSIRLPCWLVSKKWSKSPIIRKKPRINNNKTISLSFVFPK